MVLYFSATGNTEYIAKKIAEKTGDEALNLLDRIQRIDYSEIYSKKPFVICSPIYIGEMPRFFAAFLKGLKLTGNRRVYFVFTSGGYAGVASSQARMISAWKKMIYMGRAEIKMPRNYPVSKRYPILSDAENLKRLREAVAKLPKTVARIRRGKYLWGRHIFLLEKLITVPFNPLWVKYKQPATPFYTTEKCTGCGKCAKLCPLNNITIKDNRPKWHEACAHCMACLGNCPVEAIEYGNRTQTKPKYRLSKYLKKTK